MDLVSFTLRPLNARRALDGKLGGTQRRYGRFYVQKISCPCQESNQDSCYPARSRVTTQTSLPCPIRGATQKFPKFECRSLTT
jgi:hypothetical protein